MWGLEGLATPRRSGLVYKPMWGSQETGTQKPGWEGKAGLDVGRQGGMEPGEGNEENCTLAGVEEKGARGQLRPMQSPPLYAEKSPSLPAAPTSFHCSSRGLSTHHVDHGDRPNAVHVDVHINERGLN